MKTFRTSVVRARLAAALLCGAVATVGAFAHGDEDHGASAPTASASGPSLLPRASTTTEDFEVVAVLETEAMRLVIYLDRAAGNEPVSQATIEVEGLGAPAGASAKATETAPGVYALPLAQAPAPGAHALSFTVQSTFGADLIAATLNVPAAAQVAAGAPTQAARAAAIAAAPATWAGAAALLAGGGVALVRRRRRHASARAAHPATVVQPSPERPAS